jgi:hypothetical protein
MYNSVYRLKIKNIINFDAAPEGSAIFNKMNYYGKR